MSLIKCIDCGHDVSSRARMCPNCGCPVSISENWDIVSKRYNVILVSVGDKQRLKTARFINELTGLDKSIALDSLDDLPQILVTAVSMETAKSIKETLAAINDICEIKENTDISVLQDKNISKTLKSTFLYQSNKPIICPRCGSNQISTGSRGFSAVWGFIGSGQTVNRCGKCGYSWKP